MADLGIPQAQWLVPATDSVKQKWLEVKKQEVRSKIARAKQDIDDIMNGRVIGLKAQIEMWELELNKLNQAKIEDI